MKGRPPCAACAASIRDPLSRRFRYPFTSCADCGPYEKNRTPCADCAGEGRDACHRCGPRARLARADGRPFTWQSYSMLDEIDAVTTLLQRGEIVAIEGYGEYHLCADAGREEAVARLRAHVGGALSFMAMTGRSDAPPTALHRLALGRMRGVVAYASGDPAGIAGWVLERDQDQDQDQDQDHGPEVDDAYAYAYDSNPDRNRKRHRAPDPDRAPDPARAPDPDRAPAPDRRLP